MELLEKLRHLIRTNNYNLAEALWDGLPRFTQLRLILSTKIDRERIKELDKMIEHESWWLFRTCLVIDILNPKYNSSEEYYNLLKDINNIYGNN
jgi:hypothetical protein